MLIDRLQNGSIVSLELVTEDKKYEITSRVTGAADHAVLIESVKANRNLSMLDKASLDKAVYNLYADDPDGHRVGWYNVEVKPIDYKNHIYRGIYTKVFNQNSCNSDRRDNDRLQLDDVVGQLEEENGTVQSVVIHDVSNHGISFYCEDENFLNKRFMIHIEDVVNAEKYQVNIRCTCVRIGNEDGKTLFGCDIGEAERAYLNYICEKKLMHKCAKKAAG